MAEAKRDSTEHDPLIGEIIASRYQVEARLGEGAMGAVYRAKHVKVGRPFAVKILHSRLLVDPKVAERFDREAELAGRLRHPNVIGVVDVGETQGTRYMVMDYAEGQDLATMLDDAPFTAARVLSISRQLCDGLFHAHEQGLIHRDFKPENVIIERDSQGNDVPRIVDFGIAILREAGESASSPGRLTTNGLVLGTPHYMAPEQAVADPIDHRIDLFALGIMMYEMLSGRLPFDGTGAEVARANLMLDPPLIAQRVPFLQVDPLLEAMSRRLMSKQRDMRPPTARAARELLDLIERDPEAAAAQLGVPVAARMPMETAPMSSREIRGGQREPTPSEDMTPTPAGEMAVRVPEELRSRPQLVTPPQAPPMVTPVAMPTRPRMGLDTEPAEPLDWVPPKRSKAPMFAALGALLLLGGAITFAVTRSGAGDDDTKVAHQPKTKPVPAETDAKKPDPPKPVEIKQQDPPPVQTQTEVKKDPPPQEVVKKDPPPPVQTEVKKKDPPVQSIGPVQTHVEVTRKDPPPTKPVETVSLPTAEINSGQLGQFYQAVGNELGALKAAQGMNATNDLFQAYGKFQINDEMKASAQRKAAVYAELQRIHREVATRTKAAATPPKK